MSEQKLQKDCIKLLKLYDIFHYRQNTGRRGGVNFGTPGAPDIVAVIKGLYIGFEIKAPKGVQSPGQIEFENQLKKAGGKYYVITRLEMLIEIINNICKNNP